ncbi:hypothetical protein XBFFL1_1250005 [Xenorhabdus bovienii str. feltiae Florida]|nr:hypothetical protein XBFFL1_1250005 [Xenorhabdus bovienii str. feltiae Florida]
MIGTLHKGGAFIVKSGWLGCLGWKYVIKRNIRAVAIKNLDKFAA